MKESAWLQAIYDWNGSVISCTIKWREEMIEVVPAPGNGPTREFQRADEIIQALIKARSNETSH